MAIKNISGDMVFTYANAGHYSGYQFPDINSSTSLTSGVWVKLTNAIPFVLWSYDGSGGGYIRIQHDGVNWMLSVNGTTNVINAIALNTWVFLGYIKAADNHKVYYGVDHATNPSIFTRVNVNISVTFTFTLFTLKTNAGNAACAFKMFDGVYPAFNFPMGWTIDPQMIPGGVSLRWSAFMRRPGDLFAHQYPFTYTGTGTWEERHVWTTLPLWTTLTFEADPTYLNPLWCYAFIMPIGGINTPHLEGQSVLLDPLGYVEVRDGFFKFEDRGAVPLNPTDAPIQYIRYQGYQYNTDVVFTTIISIIRRVRYKDPSGFLLELNRNTHDQLGTQGAIPYSFNYSTLPPVTTTSPDSNSNYQMTAANIYNWEFGVLWPFNNTLAPGPPTNYPPHPTAHSHVTHPILTIEYIGPFKEDPGGLYYINPTKLLRRDSYYPNVEKKIPDPTIKTALIGE